MVDDADAIKRLLADVEAEISELDGAAAGTIYVTVILWAGSNADDDAAGPRKNMQACGPSAPRVIMPG